MKPFPIDRYYLKKEDFMTKKYSRVLILVMCCFALDVLKSISVTAERCADLETSCSTQAWLPRYYGSPPYCDVWKGYSENDEAEKECKKSHEKGESPWLACKAGFTAVMLDRGKGQKQCN